jgi:hypothetical protein
MTPGRILAVLLTLFAAALWPRSTAAQTGDIHYRSWHWMEEPSAGRAAGLAGASTALSDDSVAAEANPAALTTLSKNELTGSLLRRGSGRSPLGDALAARTGLGFGALAGRLNSRWAIGAFTFEPHAVRIDLASSPLADGSRDEGHLEGVVVQRGASLAFRVNPRVHVGARISANHLDLAGEYRRAADPGEPRLRVQTEGDSTRVSTRLGVLLELTRRLRLGLTRESGARFPVQRTATSPVLGQTLDAGSREEVRQPSVVSGGLAFRASPKLLVSGQLDYVRFGTLEPGDVVRPGGYAQSSYELFTWESRLGVEVSVPLPSVSVQLRAGVHNLGSGALRVLGGSVAVAAPAAPMPQPTPPPTTTFPGQPAPDQSPLTTAELERQRERAALLSQITALREPPPAIRRESPLISLGAAVVTSKGVRFDVAARLRGERPALLFATTLRF